MNNELNCCRIKDESENPETAMELLAAMNREVSGWRNQEENISILTIYCSSAKEAENIRGKILEKAPEWNSLGVRITEVETVSVKREDWAEVWKKHFKIKHISERLLIKPSWIPYTPRHGEAAITLDPGMSFGTGHHPTTDFCLKMIDLLSRDKKGLTFLDAGCGSGILSIAAFMLGYTRVRAFDIDPEAEITSAENFAENGIGKNDIKLETVPLEKFDPEGTRYDVVSANILSGVLMKNRKHLHGLVKDNGTLILAGILSGEYENISSAFEDIGFTEIDARTEKEWTSGLFKKIF
jgi:ribosomal protein L11 methyltransferase